MENFAMIKLSIIVPIYGVEAYLRKCVDSLLAQDLPASDYEIILVDDGSPDSCPQICDEYVKAYPQPLSKGKGDSFASVWGAHTADSTQYNLLKENAQENRKNPTEAESVLWNLLKANKTGLHFRRQHVILDYIVDFICLEKGLVIELDGDYHNVPEQVEHDKQRTAHLKQLGYTELRFTNEELLTNPDAVIARIKSVASSLPSLQGRVGERPLIRVIHRKNGGLSAARNSGIEAARGEYLMFVDSDDYIEPNVLGGLMTQVERDSLDVLRYRLQYVNPQYQVYNPYKSDPFKGNDYSESVTDGVTFLNTRMSTACYAWAFVLRRDLIIGKQISNIIHNISEKGDCLFTEGIYFEDTDWTPRMLVRAKRVASTCTIVYNYLQREGSITKAVNRSKQQKVLDDKMRLIGEMQRQAKELQEKGLNNAWFSRMIADTVISVIGILSVDFYNERKAYLKQLNQMNIYPLQAKSPKAKLINISPRLTVELLYWKNARSI